MFTKIINTEYKDYSQIDKKLKFIESFLRAEIEFEGCKTSIQSCMDSDIDFSMKFHILFNDGFRLKGNLISVIDKNYTIIKKDKNMERWSIYEYEYGDEEKNSYDYQFDFWEKYITK